VRFVDTNILLYAISRDASERGKRTVASELLGERDLALSAQVLREFYVRATRSGRADALTHRQASELVTSFARFRVQPTTLELVRGAMALREPFGVSYWDAAVLEAARMLGCREVLSEELSHGRDYDGTVVVNPFL